MCGNLFAILQVTEMILIKKATKFVVIIYCYQNNAVCSQGKIDEMNTSELFLVVIAFSLHKKCFNSFASLFILVYGAIDDFQSNLD
jgi:hypothetical protein